MIESRVLCWWLILITACHPALDSTNLIAHTPHNKTQGWVCVFKNVEVWPGGLHLPPPSLLVALSAVGRVSRSPKKFENMDSLLFYAPNSNPVWAYNGALFSESGERGRPQEWPPSLNSGFHAAEGKKIHVFMCTCVSECPWDASMRSWVCPTSASPHWRCADLIRRERLISWCSHI